MISENLKPSSSTVFNHPNFKLLTLILLCAFFGRAESRAARRTVPLDPITFDPADAEECSVYQNVSLHALVDKLCYDCAGYFQDKDFHFKCRQNCFENDEFDRCWLLAGGAKASGLDEADRIEDEGFDPPGNGTAAEDPTGSARNETMSTADSGRIQERILTLSRTLCPPRLKRLCFTQLDRLCPNGRTSFACRWGYKMCDMLHTSLNLFLRVQC